MVEPSARQLLQPMTSGKHDLCDICDQLDQPQHTQNSHGWTGTNDVHLSTRLLAPICNSCSERAVPCVTKPGQ